MLMSLQKLKRDSKAKFNSLFEISLAGGEAIEKFTHVNSIGSIHPSPDGKTIAFFGDKQAALLITFKDK